MVALPFLDHAHVYNIGKSVYLCMYVFVDRHNCAMSYGA